MANGFPSLAGSSQRKVRETVSAQAKSLVDVARAQDRLLEEVQRLQRLTNWRIGAIEGWVNGLAALPWWKRAWYAIARMPALPTPFVPITERGVEVPPLPEGHRGFWCAHCAAPIDGHPKLKREPATDRRFPICETCDRLPLGLDPIESDAQIAEMVDAAHAEAANDDLADAEAPRELSAAEALADKIVGRGKVTRG